MADNVGNLLGSRATFLYETDGGTSYNMLLDESVSSAVGNNLSTVNVAALRASGRRPIGPRYILLSLVSDPTVRKTAIICDAANPLFARDAAGTVTINGVAWNITGRIGEQASFLVLAPPPGP